MIKDGKRLQAHSDQCRARIEEKLGMTPAGGERLARRDSVINEAQTKELEKSEKRREVESSDRAPLGATAAAISSMRI